MTLALVGMVYLRSVALVLLVLLHPLALVSAAQLDEENSSTYERIFTSPINVAVTPKEIVMYPGNIITIKCSTSSNEKAHDPLHVSFFRLLNPYTVLPLSSGDTGILVQPGMPDDPMSGEDVRLLTLGKFAWHTLNWGRNTFYCKSQSLSGMKSYEFFTVVKEPSSRSMDRHRRYSLERNYLDKYGIE